MIALKLAFRNLVGAGLRTWLNVGVLSFAFVFIVFYNGMLDGWNQQAYRDTREWETGRGQIWHPAYDPFDQYCLQDAHGPVTGALAQMRAEGKITPILISQGAIFPHGRIQNVLLKGIDPDQKILQIPAFALKTTENSLPALIGKRMASYCKLHKGDRVTLRWRDKNGAFDAREILIADVFSCNVPTVDNNQIWIPLDSLRALTGYDNEATIFIVGAQYAGGQIDPWVFKDLHFLLRDIDAVIQSKKGSAAIVYGLLLIIALLAIFDTQVLSVFRRQKEIGTYIALGMTRGQVVRIFTIEGSMHSILAIILGALYGIPLLYYIGKTGIPMPKTTDSYGLSIAERIIPVYGLELLLSTILLVTISATIVSYFPARRIAKLNPTDALKGKIQ